MIETVIVDHETKTIYVDGDYITYIQRNEAQNCTFPVEHLPYWCNAILVEVRKSGACGYGQAYARLFLEAWVNTHGADKPELPFTEEQLKALRGSYVEYAMGSRRVALSLPKAWSKQLALAVGYKDLEWLDKDLVGMTDKYEGGGNYDDDDNPAHDQDVELDFNPTGANDDDDDDDEWEDEEGDDEEE